MRVRINRAYLSLPLLALGIACSSQTHTPAGPKAPVALPSTASPSVSGGSALNAVQASVVGSLSIAARDQAKGFAFTGGFVVVRAGHVLFLSMHRQGELVRAQTDANGRYSLQLPPGTYTVGGYVGTYARGRFPCVTRQLTITDSTPKTVNLRCDR